MFYISDQRLKCCLWGRFAESEDEVICVEPKKDPQPARVQSMARLFQMMFEKKTKNTTSSAKKETCDSKSFSLSLINNNIFELATNLIFVVVFQSVH